MATTFTVLPTPTFVYESDDTVTSVYAYAIVPVGTFRTASDGTEYRFIRFSDGTANLAATAGQLLYYTTVTTFDGVVTNDVSDTNVNRVAGVALAGMTDGQLGWIQVSGIATVNTDGDDDIAAGDAIIGASGTDGACESVAADTAPTNKIVGFAIAADVNASNTVIVELALR
jgi:predicted RecA/RadA family phage recombinase